MRMFEDASRLNFTLANDEHLSSHVFLGLATEKLGRDADAEKAYKIAINAKPKDTLALQGLITLCEKQRGTKIDVYHQAAIRLAEIYMGECVDLTHFHM